jgi:hypothetical protein
MKWERTKDSKESWKLGKWVLIRWEMKRLWALYLDDSNWSPKTRIIEFPYETSTEEAKEKAFNYIINKLSNNELRELQRKNQNDNPD